MVFVVGQHFIIKSFPFRLIFPKSHICSKPIGFQAVRYLNELLQIMAKLKSVEAFEKTVKNKFNLYNSLFLNLPYSRIENVGMLIPVLYHASKEGLDQGKEPTEILDAFFATQAKLQSEQEQIEFIFRVIQYVERQVVLFDSVEDAALPQIREMGDDLSIRDFFHQFASEENFDEIVKKLASFSARIVFTAHPTQFYPPRVLDIIAKLRNFITDDDVNEIDLSLQQLGMTSLLNPEKPTPLDEARNIIYFLRHVYYNALGAFYSELKNTIDNPAFENRDLIKLGFWPGGDRDGNPFVTSEITIAVADELRMSLMKCYYNDLKILQRKLTFRGVEEKLQMIRAKVYQVMFDSNKTITPDQILVPLTQIQEIIQKNYNGLYLDQLNQLIDKVKIFRTHFANLDIRQNHKVHLNAIQILLKQNGLISQNLEELNDSELINILADQKLKKDQIQVDDPLIRDCISMIGNIRHIQEKNGEDGCNRYIISNSEDVYSVLFVFALLRWYGKFENDIKVDVVPLFETMAGMDNAEMIMRKLFTIPAYRKHVESRGNKQTIMLGFSDGTKDGGYLKANWSIFKTKERLTAVCKEFGIDAIYFDGRGGPPARGGGRTHRFYAAQSENIANHEIQLTIQGQTISSKYGTDAHFKFNVEQLLTAGLYNTFFSHKNAVSPEDRQLIEKLAEISFEKYASLKNHPLFIPYLERMSTLKYYGGANIGSRPARRGQSKKLELSDLRAISYVGSWSQLKQNVPGYFGIGTALKALENEGRLDTLKHLFAEIPFFKALMLNSMMSLYKCYFELTSYMAKSDEFGEFWNMMFDEYKLSREMLLKISGCEVLMEEEPISRNSVEIREKIVLPLLVIQQYALQKIHQNAPGKETWEKIVQRSLYGNINASRNSA